VPELPEVETIKRELEKKILGKEIVNIKVNREKVIKEPGAEAFRKGIIGETVKRIIRRGKALIIELRGDKFLIIHLRITGWLLYGGEDEKARIVFGFSDGNFLNYMDQRLLGELKLREAYCDLKFIKELGPEALEISLSEFKEILKSRKTKIKVLLMDQHLISGIGNIYAQEALFLASIDPRRLANSLKGSEISLLHEKMVSVLKEAIKHKGSSVDSYRGIEGARGGMEKRLKVYGRKNESCLRCNTSIKKIALGGRGTCFCPHCQK